MDKRKTTKSDRIIDIEKDNQTFSSSTAAAQLNIIQPRRRTFQNYVLIWLDSNLNESKTDCRNIWIPLRSIVNDINVFTNPDECVDFLTDIESEKAFKIVSGTLDQHIVPIIHEIPQLETIYIYCNNKAEYEQWIAECFQVNGVHTKMTPIYEALQQAVKQCDEDSIPISFVTVDKIVSNKNLDELEPSFMYTQIFKEIFLKMKYDRQSIKDFTDYCRSGDYGSVSNINRFEKEYSSHLAVWWCTYPSFIFSMLNRALRTLESDILMKMGFFISDLHCQIEQLHRQQFIEHQGEVFTVYRGQSLSIQDFEKLQRAKDGLISFNNFLSTSLEQELSFGFAHAASTKPDSVGIHFEIMVDPSISSTPFALIDEVSYFKTEKEILFSMHTVFRIGEIIKIDDNNLLYQVKLKLTSDDDRQLRTLTEYVRGETFADKEPCHRMGHLLLKLGQVDQAEQVYSNALQQTTDDKEKADIYKELGRIKFDQGDYKKAILFHDDALEIYKKTLPSNHPGLAIYYNNIGVLYRHMGEYLKALSSQEKALEIYQNTLPSNHPLLATSYNSRGSIYDNMGEYSKALSFYEKALEIRQKALPSNHPDLATSYSNIGEVYRHMGQYSKAVSSQEKALEIRQKTLPRNHLFLATSYNNIGEIYRHMGQYSKALSSQEKALEIRLKTLSPNHPCFANSYSNIGSLYYSMGEYSKALSSQEKALHIGQQSLPPNHPDLASSYDSIGSVYYSLGEYSKALLFYEKALDIYEKSLPSNHPDLATSYNNIGEAYRQMKEYEKAVLSQEKALEIYEKALPLNHPDLATSYNNIGEAYRQMGEYSKALSSHEKALEIYGKTLPPNHPLLATSYNNIGLVYRSMEEHSKALSSQEKALEIRQQSLPANHPDLATSYNNIGLVYRSIGEYTKALSFLEHAFEMFQQSLPPNHSILLTVRNNIESLKTNL